MTTKFSIGQDVWFMNNNQPTCMRVCKIDIQSIPTKYNTNEGDNYGDVLEWSQPNIRYAFWDCDGITTFSKWESEVFATKEDLGEYVFGFKRDLLSTPIEQTELSYRAIVNLADGCDVFTVGQLMEWTKHDLLKVRQIGKATVAEIESMLDKLGLKLKDR